MTDITIKEVERLHLGPDDIAVLKVPHCIDIATVRRLRDAWQSLYAGKHDAPQILVLDGGVDIAVMSIERMKEQGWVKPCTSSPACS